jgi:hypothetical protein
LAHSRAKRRDGPGCCYCPIVGTHAPDLKSRLEAQGLTLPLGTPEEFGAHVAAETQRWGEVIRKGNIKIE